MAGRWRRCRERDELEVDDAAVTRGLWIRTRAEIEVNDGGVEVGRAGRGDQGGDDDREGSTAMEGWVQV